ncbi:MAG: 16S rRNA (guanine(966)-N(2))-methyltransferase RsmD [Alkalibacterium thalassium]|nr:16S rRNA (guanine(966)-N(2))-methyltransferase RsmD [Alkalibacterium thalassium]
MRVISGEYGGRPLKSLKGSNTRPTTDKIKESLFHMIGPYFSGGTALDLYSGSGALGIEAVSRGMDKAYLVDINQSAVSVINENVKMTREEDKFIVWKKKDRQALASLKTAEETFDLVFLDPPYAKQQIEEVIGLLVSYELLKPDALIVCETDKHVLITPTSHRLAVYKEKTYGTTKLTIFEWVEE